MIKYVTSVLLIGISITVFLLFAEPIYTEIATKKSDQATYNQARNNSETLGKERDRLIQTRNTFSSEDLAKLKKLLPDHVDNIRLILEIEKIATPYNMVLKDVQYSAVQEDTNATASSGDTSTRGGGIGKNQSANTDYGSWDLGFSTTGTYSNLISFMKDLESNLRIVDILSVQFSSITGAKVDSSLPETYKITFKIRTYWLKN